MTRKMTGRTKNQTDPRLNLPLSARKLQIAVARTMPLYAHIAVDPTYTEQLTHSINKRDADLTMRLVNQILPFVDVSAGAGFGTMFKMDNTYLEVGTYRPGKKMSTQDMQMVAKTILPLMNMVAASDNFTIALLQQYGKNNKRELLRLVTTYIPAERIKDAGTDHYGFYFVINSSSGAKYNFTLYIY